MSKQGVSWGHGDDLNAIQQGSYAGLGAQGEWLHWGDTDGDDTQFGVTKMGGLYCMNRSGEWVLASASWSGADTGTPASSSILAIAQGMGASMGLLKRGYVYVGQVPPMGLDSRFSGSWAAGQAVYMATGVMGADNGMQYCDEFSKPGGSGQFARLLGYMSSTWGVIYIDT